MNLELVSNTLQLLVSAMAAFWATSLAVQRKSTTYTLVAGALDTFFLGILYWLTYQFMTDMTPQIFYVSDISWFAAYLFLLALELHLTAPETKTHRHWLVYIPIPIGLALTVYFCQWGDIFMNVSTMTPLTICACLAIQNLLVGDGMSKPIHKFCLLLIGTEYALWLASCFWISDTWTNPYFWFDFALTLELGLFLPIVKKAVDG